MSASHSSQLEVEWKGFVECKSNATEQTLGLGIEDMNSISSIWEKSFIQLTHTYTPARSLCVRTHTDKHKRTKFKTTQ